MTISILIFLQIFFILINRIYSEDTFDCTGYEDDSYHPIYNADDCRHYWHCIYVNTVYMHAVKRVCPAGTEFDSELRQCETSSLVNCALIRSPHLPRTSSTTEAWRWKYSRLFSRLNWKPTIPYFVTTRKHPIFDLGDSSDIELTTMILPEIETTEQIQVLPVTLPPAATLVSLEQLSKNLHAFISNRQSSQHKPSLGTKFFQPGEPENEAEIYTSTTIRRHPIRHTRYTTQTTTIQTTTQLPITTLFFTTETTTTTTTTTTTFIPTTTTMLIITTDTSSPLPATLITQTETIKNIKPQSRIGTHRRRSNMTLYILTSDEHKIRQFSVNHTRGILINCNQLRRRLLGRRRSRDILSISATSHSLTLKNSSIDIYQYNILLLTIFSFLFFTKILLIT